MNGGRQSVDTRLGKLVVGDFGQGDPVVMWHSLFVDDRSWDRVRPEIGRGRRVISITGPGHGLSRDPGHPYTLQDCAEAALGVLDHLGVVEPVDWVGNAWGGHVGVLLAVAHPDRCNSVVALGAPIQPLTPHERARTRLLLGLYRLLGARGIITDAVTKVLLSPRTRVDDPEAVELVRDSLAKAHPAWLRNAIASISLDRPDISDYLPQLRCPTLIATGSDHSGWTPDQARAAAAKLAQGQCAVVPDCAYLIPLENPQATIELIQDFWANVSPRHPSRAIDRP